MSVLYAIDKATLDGIGNAIRSKKGTTEPIPVTSLADEIASIGGGSAGVLLQAGKYKMTDYQYEDSYPGSLAWGSQELRGKITCDYANVSNADFVTVATDGYASIWFSNNGTYVADYLPSWNPYDYNTYIVLDEAQFISEAFSTWFNACFTKVDTLQAGTYKLVDYRYEGSYPGSFAWERQNLHGMFWGGGYGEDERPFTFVEADDEWSVCFVDEVDVVSSWITPSYNPIENPIKVILEESQLVSTSFSAWFNTCFNRVIEDLVPENIKKGVTILGVTGTYDPVSELSVIRSGEYAIIYNYPDCYLDYDDGGGYGGVADIVGTYSEDGTVYEFDKIGLGGNTDGPPYATISLYKNGEYVYSIGGDDGWSIGENWYFNIPSDSIATKIFCALFMGMVLRKE